MSLEREGIPQLSHLPQTICLAVCVCVCICLCLSLSLSFFMPSPSHPLPSLYLPPLSHSLPLSPSQHLLSDNHCQRTSRRSASLDSITRQAGGPGRRGGEGRGKCPLKKFNSCDVLDFCVTACSLSGYGLHRGIRGVDWRQILGREEKRPSSQAISRLSL